MTDELIGIRGIAELIGLTRLTTYGMSTAGKLPPTDAVIDGKRLWLTSTIQKWDEARRKNPRSRIKRV